ncbi:MAG: N5-carboxyaminoimidazole ribonucleotide mutase [Candidatus Moranbacteria bacterium GW2011_GWF2_34_56]|nr:MAG: N5-carboxyaminoimidazole ribonucleotide mutase [Candidatus Moranbacteria bacterium GW2011_GWF1_34_10]KKP65286.1 MAG: N5-carboxyaminoimidazole ribonucleotide mutase [Candidatus Moranbacteria bacterium GW2011_GWF2_34_56]HBI17535.1 5-(carboxyamino)imidazole ribonucleotide mutase [Candidatus Moranbacteria bacterium]
MAEVTVAIFIGSDSDIKKMLPAKEFLDSLGISCEMRITSAHRTAERTKVLVCELEKGGCKIFLCAAGMAAHLAGAVAAQTIKLVIGVPLTSEASPLGGVDALLSTVQMPSGMPVATVAINGAKNAAWLAAEILALNDAVLTEKLIAKRVKTAKETEEADKNLQQNIKYMFTSPE